MRRVRDAVLLRASRTVGAFLGAEWWRCARAPGRLMPRSCTCRVCACSSVYAVRVQCARVAHAVRTRCARGAHAVRVPHRAPLGVDKPLALSREPPVALIRPAALVGLGGCSGPGLDLGFGGVHLRGHVDRGSLQQVPGEPVARRRSVACSSCATRTRLREGDN